MESWGVLRSGLANPAAIVVAVFGISFLVADLNFYGITGNPPCMPTNCTATVPKPSVKLMMQDHFGHYVHHYSAEVFEDVTHISELPFISPNFVTTVHLMIGIFAGWLMGSENLRVRQISIVLFQFRIFLDMLDGVVYRRQSHTFMYVNGWGSIGYYIDAAADILASVALLYGLNTFLARHPPRRCEGLPLRSPPEPMTDVPVSRSTIASTILLCFVQGCVRGAFWDRYQFAFHSILNKPLHSKADAILQARIFNSPLTRFVLWCWKLSSAEGMLGFVYVSIFLDFTWPMLVIIRKYGFIQLLVVVVISQLHSWQVHELLAKAL